MKRTYKIASIILLIVILFWIGETVFFLIKDGWHYRPLSVAEAQCDKIVSYIFTLGWIFIAWAMIQTIQWAIRAKDDIELLFELLERNTEVTRANSKSFMSLMDDLKKAFDSIGKSSDKKPEEKVEKTE